MGLRVLISGGGTGGHLFPGIATAEELGRRVGAEVRFMGSRHGIERTAVARAGLDVDLLPVRGVMGEGLRGAARAAWQVPRSVGLAFGLLGRWHPDLVVGVGGYAAFPGLAAAVLRRIPIVLLEQNARPGLVTRLFARFARRICVSFEETVAQLPGRAVVTGNPVRWSVGRGRGAEHEPSEAFRVLVFGGSAGAHRLNMVCPPALARVGGRLEIVHQTGERDRAAVERRYRELGVEASVRAFIDDMRTEYVRCDLAICRSGASTIAEITALGVAAILVPFPFAADDHQKSNAEALVRAGAAWMIEDRELDEDVLATHVLAARGDSVDLEHRRERARLLGRPDAVRKVVDECLAAVGKNA